jgi:hypothetical protein
MYTCLLLKSNEDEKLRAKFGPTNNEYYYIKEEKEEKAIPLQAWTGPEDSRRLRLPDFKTIGT